MSSNNLTWFYSPSYSYKSYILLQLSLHLLTLKQKMCFQLKKPVLLYTQTFCCSCWTLLRYEKVKREISNATCAFYTKHTDKFTSPKHKLLAFLVKGNTTWDKGLSGSRRHKFRHLQHSCSNRAAVLLTFLKDNAQNYHSYCSSYIPEIRTIVLFLPF